MVTLAIRIACILLLMFGVIAFVPFAFVVDSSTLILLQIFIGIMLMSIIFDPKYKEENMQKIQNAIKLYFVLMITEGVICDLKVFITNHMPFNEMGLLFSYLDGLEECIAGIGIVLFIKGRDSFSLDNNQISIHKILIGIIFIINDSIIFIWYAVNFLYESSTLFIAERFSSKLMRNIDHDVFSEKNTALKCSKKCEVENCYEKKK